MRLFRFNRIRAACSLGVCLALQACLAGIDPVFTETARVEIGSGLTDPVVAFREVCLTGRTTPQSIAALALDQGWQPANETDLEAVGLTKLRKRVLEIPGGGAKVSEEQHLLALRSESYSAPLILSAERRIGDARTRSTRCAVYAEGPFLSQCEAMGRLAGKAPDSNQRYEATGAHFIRWQGVVENRPAALGCETTPQSPTLAYSGTVLSLTLDYTRHKETVRASLPRAAASAR
ncbi:hypothetical protein [Salaquimonas pukyongi]|uniref:hypothetical protein n=1 Tax=Salaquimonas pukyongi TaxID=2712698 RepID=UPI00096B7E4E|nr:hypothetical protein [Salaquimonas pukyongi]